MTQTQTFPQTKVVDKKPSIIRTLTDAITYDVNLSKKPSFDNIPSISIPLVASPTKLSSTQLSSTQSSSLPVISRQSPGINFENDLGLTKFNESATQPLLLARNGYDRLATLAQQMQENQTLLARGMRCSQSSFANTLHSSKRTALGLVGINYVVPDLRETVHLQLMNVRQYGACVDEIIGQTQSEIKKAHSYVASLAKEIFKYNSIKEKLQPEISTQHSAQELSNLQLATSDIKKLEDFVSKHDSQIKSRMHLSDFVVADRAIRRKGEYLSHAYAVELLLIGSLTTAKQIAVDAGSYAGMLDRLASAYFNMGCNSKQLNEILGGLQSMQQFTDGMQTSVATGLQRLDKALLQTRTTVGPQLETAVYNLRS